MVILLGENILSLVFEFDTKKLHYISVIFYVSLLPLAMSSFWGYPALVPFGYEKEAHSGILISSISYYIALFAIFVMDVISLVSLVSCILFADIIGMTMRFYYASKKLKLKIWLD